MHVYCSFIIHAKNNQIIFVAMTNYESDRIMQIISKNFVMWHAWEWDIYNVTAARLDRQHTLIKLYFLFMLFYSNG